MQRFDIYSPVSVNRLGEDDARRVYLDVCVCACFCVNLQFAHACESVVLWGILFLAGDRGWESVCMFTFSCCSSAEGSL